MTKQLLVDGDLLLYGDVGDPYGWGDGFTPTDVANALAEHGAGDLTVRINSGGGVAQDGMAIYSLLKTHDGKVSVLVDGMAASAASLIAMAGTSREMRQGAMMMIHDPAGITFGNEAAHAKATAKLGKISDNYAGVYAKASGKKNAEARDLMKAETWLTADEAVTHGFATKAIDEPAAQMSAFDYRIYARAPASLPMRMRAIDEPAATAALTERDVQMDKTKWQADFYMAAGASGLGRDVIDAIFAGADSLDKAKAAMAIKVADKKATDQAERDRVTAAAAGTAVAQATAAQKPWAAAFYASAGVANIPLADLNKIVAESASIEVAKDKLIDAMSAASNVNKPGISGGGATVGMDDREKFIAGATKALIGKVALFNGRDGKPDKEGERNEFSSLTLRELARMSLEKNGIRVAMHDPLVMVQRAMSPIVMAGAMSTSDFTNILANVANKAMLKGYEESPENFSQWTAAGTLTDFKTSTRVDLGLFPSLAKVDEGAEYTYAKMSDRGVTLILATYGKLFPITRQAIINDDLSAFTKIPAKMGNASKRTIGDLVYAILTANAAMADTVALFHATHKNLQTGAGSVLSATSLDKGRADMGKQTDPDSIKSGLNIRPAYWIGPIALQGSANQVFASQSEPGQENPAVANRVANMAKVVTDARLDVASTTAWYLAADPATYDTIEVSYLNGAQQPTLEQREGWAVDGVEFKVRMDAGVTVLDFRGLYKSNGA